MNKLKLFLPGAFLTLLVVGYFNNILELIPQKELHGVTNIIVKPEYKISDYFSGEYQQQYEQYYSKNFPLRNNIIRNYSQLKYSLFNKGAVVKGKEGTLFEEWYINEYLGIDTEVSQSYIDALTDDIKVINEICKKNNKEFYVIITPSKADLYSDYIPERYFKLASNREGYVRNYDIFSQSLIENNIKVFDASKYLKENKNEIKIPLFPKTGTHWNFVAAAYALSEAVDYINETSNLELKTFNVVGVKKSAKPFFGEDIDIYNIMNVDNGMMDEYYYAPEIEVSYLESQSSPKLFMEGGSFCTQLLHNITEQNIINNIDFMFYQKYIRNYKDGIISDTQIENGQASKENLDLSLNDKDVIILEVNQQAVATMGSGFPKVLREYLEKYGFPGQAIDQ